MRATRVLHTPPLEILQERGVHSYSSDGAAVSRLSNAKVVGALQKLWGILLSETAETLMIALASRMPPPLVFRRELRSPNANSRRIPTVPGKIPRSEPEACAGPLLQCGSVHAHDVVSVGRGFDGAPLLLFLSSAFNQASAGGGMGASLSNLSGGGRAFKNWAPRQC
ncbi:hypothetical protein TraAM80_01319 [Trypanosoma rangeli]|uniref:Uncharacterized protein n=1 Tax=Trypanosoma rangeli TaxID=5698 RepID=A0A3R7N094_TRYRA|nr:uncharacterized protein TraAM80_01319 [Trypanosoma rangeli]RNF10758.1 hypothetical protein TraAM80_01319 [Trypanosoma rangeli]|eukprot:RNF10758.1 hypothetical protein TraAM80_01319 [Trypanosoma rangeli]